MFHVAAKRVTALPTDFESVRYFALDGFPYNAVNELQFLANANTSIEQSGAEFIFESSPDHAASLVFFETISDPLNWRLTTIRIGHRYSSLSPLRLNRSRMADLLYFHGSVGTVSS